MTRGRLTGGVLLVASLWAGMAGAAWAAWNGAASQTHTISSATLAAPTSPLAAGGACVPLSADEIVVTWVATTSLWADGYEVLRSTTSGGPYAVIGTVGNPATTVYTDSNLPFSTTYHYVVRATKGTGWTSSNTSQVSFTTRSALCL